MQKILTISIAAYNVESYIAEALESIRRCESVLDDIEVLVIDDGGTDGTYAIAKHYQEEYPQSFAVVHKENGGWGSTVNYAIAHSMGKYLRLLDGDDLLDTEGLEQFVQILKTCRADVVYSPYYKFDDRTRKIIDRFYAGKAHKRNESIALPDTDIGNFVMHSLTFRVEALRRNKVRCTEKCFYTDIEYVTKGLARCETAYITDIPLYMYRYGMDLQSVGLNGIIRHCDDAVRIAEELMTFTEENAAASHLRAIKNRTDVSVLYAYRALILSGNIEKLTGFDHRLHEYEKNFGEVEDVLIRVLRHRSFTAESIRMCALYLRIRMKLAKVVKCLLAGEYMKNQSEGD